MELIAPLAMAVSKRLCLDKYKFAQGVQGAISSSTGGLGWCFGKASNAAAAWWLDASESNCCFWRMLWCLTCAGSQPQCPGAAAMGGCWVFVVPTGSLSLSWDSGAELGWLEPLWHWMCFPSVLKGVCKRLALVFVSPSCSQQQFWSAF